jgi:Tol biopolymer transport system component
MPPSPQPTYEFGSFRLEVGSRQLSRHGQPLALTPKAFDVLLAIVRRQGGVATKDDLMREVWADVIVEESNLTQTVFMLRRSLGDGADRVIETMPRRGYRLGVPVLVPTRSAPAVTPPGPVLYRASVTGGVPQRVLDDLSTAAAPSPDGRSLAFVRWQQTAGRRVLMTARSDGSEPRVVMERLSPAVILYGGVSWSADGARLAAVVNESFGGNAATLVEVDLATGAERVIAALPWNAGGALWHCDGRSVTVAAGGLWRIAYPGGDRQPLTRDTNRYTALSASADCRTFAALQENESSTVWVAPDGHGDQSSRRITEAGYNHGIAWFPDGRLAYESEAAGNPDIWVSDADGRRRVQLTTDASVDGFPAVSPDGRTVVFSGGRAGGSTIWRMNADGTNQVRISPPGAAYGADISPDGRWVVYHAADPVMSWSTFRIPLEGGPPVRLVDRPSTYARHSPDGRWIACNYLLKAGDDESWVIAVLPTGGGSPARFLGVRGRPTRRLTWTPDSLAVMYSNPDDGVYAAGLDGSAPRRVIRPSGALVTALSWSRNGRHFAFVRHERSSNAVLLTPATR